MLRFIDPQKTNIGDKTSFLIFLPHSIYLDSKFKELKMAKSQSFADKSKAKKKSDHITVKFVKSVKSDKGTYKFSEKFVRLADISKVTELK